MSWDIDALRAELALPAYQGLSDGAALVLLHGKTTPGISSIQPMDARLALMFTASNDWGWLVDVASGTTTSANASGAGTIAVTAATRRAAITVRDLFSLPTPVDILTQAKLDLLTAALTSLRNQNVITAAGANAVAAIPVVAVTPFAEVTQHDIWVARGQQ